MSNFSEVLNKYMKMSGLNQSRLSLESGISKATISRYLSGQRVPARDDESIEKIAHTLSIYIDSMDETEIFTELNGTLDDETNYDNLSLKLNKLIETFDINVNDLSKSLSFDASYISRIRTAKRHPSDPKLFISGICAYMNKHYSSKEYEGTLLNLLGSEIYNESSLNLTEKLRKWFEIDTVNKPSEIENFLHKLNDFNLDEYIKVIKFDELKVPNIPLYYTRNKAYYGLNEMKQGELDFFKSTVLSKSHDDIFMYSNMPMDDMAKDLDFNKKWMFGIAMSLKKGLRLNIIHNLNRPFNELMLGLEAWIPIYMTGQINPYHIPEKEPGMVNSLLYVSGSTALYGTCIKGHHSQGKYNLFGNKDDISYYKKQSEYFLKMAKPLMEIYPEEKREDFLNKYSGTNISYDLDSSFYEAFNNIKIGFLGDEAVFIHKEKTPNIDFVIRHHKLVNALKEFVAPVNQIH